MTIKYRPHEAPIAYSMLEAAKNLNPKQERYHPYQKYFYYWTAFNNIYTTIAFTGSRSPKLLRDKNDKVVTELKGNVNIPKIDYRAGPSEQDQIKLAFEEFDDGLKHELITHPSTNFFINRIPKWKGTPVPTDASGQRLNGVLNVNFTIDIDYPIWSPINFEIFPQYLENPKDEQLRNSLAKQILDMLYTIRCNLLHGGKRFDDGNDIEVVNKALPLLEIIVHTFLKDK